jgi:hypothetical protein
MGKFVRNIVVTKQFDGETWRVTLKPLTHADAVQLMSATRESSQEGLYMLAVQMLPRYIVEVSGGTDAAGNPITAEDVCSLAYFGPLLSEVTEEWMAQSMPGNSTPSGA